MAAAEIQVYNKENLHRIENYFNDSSYKEAIKSSASFNTRLCVERRLRMPFLDPQTGVAQNHCSLFMSKRQRMPGVREGQIYTYPAARWRKAKRQYLAFNRGGKWGNAGWNSSLNNLGDSISNDAAIAEAVADGGSLDAHDTDSKDSHQRDASGKDDPKEWFYDEIGMEELDAYDEPEPESDEDYCDENYTSTRRRRGGGGGGGGRGGAGGSAGGAKNKRSSRGGSGAGDTSRSGGDSEGTTTPKGRGRGGGRGRRKVAQQTLPYEVPGDADKPYGCELCGARYKTRPGLTYHYTHSHKEMGAGGSAGSDGDSRDSPAATPSASAAAPPPSATSTTATSSDTLNNASSASASATILQPNEYQDSYVTFLNSPATTTPARGRQKQSSVVTTPAPPSVDENSTTSDHRSSPPPSSPAVRPDDEASRSSGPSASPSSKKPNPSPYCDFCLGDHKENKKTGTPEELVSCSDCGRSGHPTCLQFTDNMIVSVRKYRWQCIECKCCSMCGTSDNDDQLLFCDDCDRGYHMYCLVPPLSTPPEGSWSCKLCIEEFHSGRGK